MSSWHWIIPGMWSTYTYTLYVVRLTCFLRSLCQTGPPYRETCPVSTCSYEVNTNTKTTESQNALVLRLRESLKVDFHSQRRFTFSSLSWSFYTLECSVNFWRKALIHTPLKIVIWKYIFEKPSTSWSLHCSAECSVKLEYNSILCFKQCLIKIHPLHIAILCAHCSIIMHTIFDYSGLTVHWVASLVQQQVFGWFSKLWLPTRWPLRSFPQMVILITINTRLRRNFLGIFLR